MFPDMMLVITMILATIRAQSVDSCVPPVLVWDRCTEVAALLNCGDGTGNTDKSLTATMCTSQEHYQASLNLSLTNRLFAECDASCVYNIYADDTQGFLWNNSYECWMPNSNGECVTKFADHYDSMTDYLENTLCPPPPTLKPTRVPSNAPTEHPTVCIELVQVWDQATASAALEDCVGGTGVTDKSLSASMCENQEQHQDSLDLSLANRLYVECDSRCVYNIDAGDTLAFLWNNQNQCWRPKSEGLCIISDDFSIMTDYMQNLCTLEPTPAPSNRPTEEPTANPTEQPTVCIELVLEWDQDTASAALEECVDGTGVTDKSFNATMCSGQEQYQDSLDLSLANRLWPSCESRCVYNIHAADVPAFLWNSANQCWRPKSDGLCIISNDFSTMTEYMQNLCTLEPTPAPSNHPTEEPTAHPTLDPTFKPSKNPTEQPTVCVELVLVWNQDTASAALEECVDGTGITDKSFSATMCSGQEQYQDDLDLSLANRLWPACESRCVYNIYATDVPAFLWNNANQCWRPKSDGACILSEDFPVMTEYIENTLCALPTMLPTAVPSMTPTELPSMSPSLPPTRLPSLPPTVQPSDCIIIIVTWDQDTASTALEECVDGTGVTDKSYSATMCTGQEQYQESLDLSLANRLWSACDSRCVYNIFADDVPAFLWNNANQCWRPKSDGVCIESEDYPVMTEYIVHTLCGFPTMTPTVAPSIPPTEEPSESPTLLPTLAPSAPPSGTPTARPTVLPSATPTVLPSAPPTENPVSPTLRPTLLVTNPPTGKPTVCVELVQTWDQDTASAALEDCVDGTGPTDKGLNAVMCEGREEYQASLDLSLANRIWVQCDSRCVYNIYPDENPALLWNDANQCWRPRSDGLCIESDDYRIMTEYIANTLCALPTLEPTRIPSNSPTEPPTVKPTVKPTPSPSTSPTVKPTPSPSGSPTHQPTVCVERVEVWNHHTAAAAIEDCDGDMGVTDKSKTAAMCENQEEYQENLNLSLANRLYPSCHSRCVYNIDATVIPAFHWSATYQCWRPRTSGTCVTSDDFTSMTEYIENTLCPE